MRINTLEFIHKMNCRSGLIIVYFNHGADDDDDEGDDNDNDDTCRAIFVSFRYTICSYNSFLFSDFSSFLF